jgi:hypothetical protein
MGDRTRNVGLLIEEGGVGGCHVVMLLEEVLKERQWCHCCTEDV